VFVGSNNHINYNCLLNNGQYGFSAYSPDGIQNIVLDHNEIAGNNTDDWETRQPECGCSGGGKFWATNGAVVTNNYVHDNHSVGLWADTNNVGFDISGNYISNNLAEGIVYEISYNARIANNTFLRNALGTGPTNPGFPTGALYLSESGGDSRAGSSFSTIEVQNNHFVDNWSGVVLTASATRRRTRATATARSSARRA
jgi:parallel beta-helix repeat protein